ncbi:peptidoglycan-binding domain-containing protein [Phreatobacter stygius]|uniref:peptidoglycan-binding domain-containing protein n=1 Tax=Phreatobacter stygius TaxID=1940610 RepID=UPI001FE7A698|nr:peptidoglycan-binding domain-containing protein [Phreatobacter stygius]
MTYDEDDLRPRRGRVAETEFDDDEPRRVPLWRQVLGRNKGDMLAIGCAAFVAIGIGVNALARQSGPHPAPLFATARVEAPAVAPMPANRPAEIQSTASITPRGQDPRPADQSATTGQPRPRADVVTDIQKELARRSLYDGPVDGRTGPRTDAAIKRYETQAGLRVSGEATEQLLSHMRRPATRSAAPAPAQTINQLLAADAVPQPSRPPPQARPEAPQSIAQLISANPGAATATRAPAQGAANAATNPADRRIQAVKRALVQAGYGPLGSDTRDAIQRFERDRGLPVTGQANDRVVRELASLTGTRIE